MAAQDEWLAAACEAKGLEPGSTEAGEELFAGVGTFVRMARLLRDALRDIAKDGKPSFAGPVREAADGRLRVQVFPDGAFDRITFPQTTAEVWMQPGVTQGVARPRPGPRLRRSDGARRHGARAGRGQRGVARPPRRPLQALRRGQDRRDEGQPGQRLPRPALEPRPGPPDRCRRAAHRRGRRRGGAVPDRARADRRGAHHRVGQDLRRRRVRHRPRRCPAQGGRRARC